MSDPNISSGGNSIEVAPKQIGRNPTPPQPLARARLTVVTKVYVNLPNENTTGPEPLSYFRWLDTEERPYSRTVKVTEEWQTVDLGWLVGKSIAHIVFENETLRPLGKIPEQVVLDEWREKVLEVGIQVGDSGAVVEPIAYFLPEEGLALSPTNPQKLRVRCRKGTGKLTYYVVPG